MKEASPEEKNKFAKRIRVNANEGTKSETNKKGRHDEVRWKAQLTKGVDSRNTDLRLVVV